MLCGQAPFPNALESVSSVYLLTSVAKQHILAILL